MVESKSERFAFKKDKIDISTKDSVILQLIRVDTRPIKVTSFRSSEKSATLRLNKSTSTIKVEPSNRQDFIYHFGNKQDEIIFRNLREEKSRDSVELDITLIDSLEIRKDTTVYLKFNNSKMSKEKFNVTFNQAQFDQEKKTISQTIHFNKLISAINFDSLFIQIDTTNIQPISNREIKLDTVNLTLQLQSKIELTPDNTPPILVYGKGAFISIDQDSSRAKTETIRILKPEQVGSLSIKIETNEPYFIIELIDRSNKITDKINNIKEYTFKALEPGD